MNNKKIKHYKHKIKEAKLLQEQLIIRIELLDLVIEELEEKIKEEKKK